LTVNIALFNFKLINLIINFIVNMAKGEKYSDFIHAYIEKMILLRDLKFCWIQMKYNFVDHQNNFRIILSDAVKNFYLLATSLSVLQRFIIILIV